jgi:hypothetical protein
MLRPAERGDAKSFGIRLAPGGNLVPLITLIELHPLYPVEQHEL